MRQHHPKGEAPDGPRQSCTTHQLRKKRPQGAFFVSAVSENFFKAKRDWFLKLSMKFAASRFEIEPAQRTGSDRKDAKANP
jgi:hypothetical protein